MSIKVVQLDAFDANKAETDFKVNSTKALRGLFARYTDLQSAMKQQVKLYAELEEVILYMHKSIEGLQKETFKND